MKCKYTAFFERLTGFEPYPYQRRVAAALLGRRAALEVGLSQEIDCIEVSTKRRLPEDGRNVLLRAPTGAGKTWAVLAPFAFSCGNNVHLADRALYALPLRALADSLYESTKKGIERLNLGTSCSVRLQTGETSGIPGVGDPTLSAGHIIFATIDQVLSSYLGIPFALSPRQANINAGALVGSLIVFDEFHLLDPGRAMYTAILLAQHQKGLTRLVWMTATQAERASQRLGGADRLDAITIGVPDAELAEIPSQRNKKRSWVWRPRPLTAEEVCRDHRSLSPGSRRTLVVVNTVYRAQQIFREIRKLVSDSIRVCLLHSRFLSEHRTETEREAANAFAHGSSKEMILVATQVVEAGLDISATQLHSELAPANALIQRAGRCARFEGEDGTVFIYDTVDGKGNRLYQPYASGLSSEIAGSGPEPSEGILSLRTAIDQTASEMARLGGHQIPFPEEVGLVDRVHSDLDLLAAESFSAFEWRRRAAEAMTPSPGYTNYGLAGDLIRDIDNVALLLADEHRLGDREARLSPRYHPATISVPRATLAALSRGGGRLPAGTWALRAPVFENTERGDGFCGYEIVARSGEGYGEWLTATYRPSPLVLNPSLGRYTRELGLELGVQSLPGDWQSTGSLTQKQVDLSIGPDQRYQAETLGQHMRLARLHAQALCGDESALTDLSIQRKRNHRDACAFQLTGHSIGLRRLDARYGLPPGTARGLAILATVLHDAGKLTKTWQHAAWSWQEAKASCREHYRPGKDGDKQFEAAQTLLQQKRNGGAVLLAHTDYDRAWRWPDGRIESEVERQFSRPNHALEGAWLVMPIVAQQLDLVNLPAEHLAKATLSAIGRHHSPAAGSSLTKRGRPLPTIAPEPAASDALRSLLDRCDDNVVLQSDQPNHTDWDDFLATNIRFELQPNGTQERGLEDWDWWPLAMVLVRIVRLADQLSTEIGAARARRE